MKHGSLWETFPRQRLTNGAPYAYLNAGGVCGIAAPAFIATPRNKPHQLSTEKEKGLAMDRQSVGLAIVRAAG